MTDFDAFMREIEVEALAEGPDAVRQLEALRKHFRGEAERIPVVVSPPSSPVMETLWRKVADAEDAE